MTPGARGWRSGVKVLMKSDRGRVSCTRWAREVNYDEVARRPPGCGPLAVFQNSSDAAGWVYWVLRRRPFETINDFANVIHRIRIESGVEGQYVYHDEVTDKIIETVPCVYKRSEDVSLWTQPSFSDEWSPIIPGGDFADVVIPMQMGDLVNIKEARG